MNQALQRPYWVEDHLAVVELYGCYAAIVGIGSLPGSFGSFEYTEREENISINTHKM